MNCYEHIMMTHAPHASPRLRNGSHKINHKTNKISKAAIWAHLFFAVRKSRLISSLG